MRKAGIQHFLKTQTIKIAVACLIHKCKSKHFFLWEVYTEKIVGHKFRTIYCQYLMFSLLDDRDGNFDNLFNLWLGYERIRF